MNSMRRFVVALGLVALVGVGAAATANAGPILFVAPTPKIVVVGEVFSIDVWIKDLIVTIGAFDIDLAFDDSILTGTSFAVDPDGNFINDFAGALSFGFGPDVVNIAESGDPAGDNLLLAPFRLGTITFTAAALGKSKLTFDYAALSNDPGGSPLLSRTLQAGVVCVVADPLNPGPCTAAVPEPGLFALLSLGLAAAAKRYTSRQRG